MVGGIWLAVDREPVVAANRRFYTVALLLLVGLVGCCMVIATIGAEGIVRPLDDLGETVAALGRGEMGTRFELEGPEELTRLGRRVNRMADALEASEATLSRLAADLDRQVRERTRELEEASRRFSTMANTDPLTGLTNRRGLEIELDRYLSLSRRNQQPLAVIMMDLDNFKTYNDKCGHLSGDTVLKAVAAALRGRARASDVVARWGGDEFCLLIPATDPDGALAATRRFVHRGAGGHGRPLALRRLGRARRQCRPRLLPGRRRRGDRAHRPRRRGAVQGQGLGRQRRAARQPQVDGDVTGEGLGASFHTLLVHVLPGEMPGSWSKSLSGHVPNRLW